jgi:hypothetical protein
LILFLECSCHRWITRVKASLCEPWLHLRVVLTMPDYA